ncbi:MAG: tRNA 2-thiouridine(34) synthase MnmA [Actinobacteria bacterium]|nr:tRNA 2-thiouridine(34) synthase MnmA [Actinomycetota bacterium]
MIEIRGDATRDEEWAHARVVVDGDRVVEADVEGLERPLAGLTLLQAAAVGGDALALDALAHAIGPVFRAAPDSGRVAVAMSGGVDSAVALLRAGPNAVGITLRLWIDPRAPHAERACCSPEAVIAARETCHGLGIPHVTIDAREAFRRSIVEPFIQDYARGETPNPCTRCNGSFRFGRLLSFAKRAGAGRLATGHYARIVEHRGRLLLARGADEEKDQSYMLARVDPGILDRLWFPLGDQTKEETRAEAERAGLQVARRPESQEACFLGGDDYRSFLERHGLGAQEGPVVDSAGERLGTHAGFWRFTPGQRRGLGVSAGVPVFAVATVPESNTVVVGPHGALARRRVRASGKLFASVTRGDVKLRYRSPAVPATVEASADGFELALERPVYGVARGQTAVVYEGDVVVGSGIVRESSA